jgi:hypothetical protein
MIDELYQDSDGYWVYTADGFYASGIDEECHTISQDTQKEVLEQIRMIKPCTCDFCKEKLNSR